MGIGGQKGAKELCWKSVSVSWSLLGFITNLPIKKVDLLRHWPENYRKKKQGSPPHPRNCVLWSRFMRAQVNQGGHEKSKPPPKKPYGIGQKLQRAWNKFSWSLSDPTNFVKIPPCCLGSSHEPSCLFSRNARKSRATSPGSYIRRLNYIVS